MVLKSPAAKLTVAVELVLVVVHLNHFRISKSKQAAPWKTEAGQPAQYFLNDLFCQIMLWLSRLKCCVCEAYRKLSRSTLWLPEQELRFTRHLAWQPIAKGGNSLLITQRHYLMSMPKSSPSTTSQRRRGEVQVRIKMRFALAKFFHGPSRACQS